MEQARVHLADVLRDAQRKLGLGEDVALEIDAGREFRDRDAVLLEPQHATFGDVDDFLPLRDRSRAGERDLLDRFDELLDLAFLGDLTAPSWISSFAPAVK